MSQSFFYVFRSAIDNRLQTLRIGNLRELGETVKLSFLISRQDTNQPSKKPLKSTFFGTQKPSSTPFCTPNFSKSPDVKVHKRT